MKDLLNGSTLLLKLSHNNSTGMTTDEEGTMSSPLLTSSPTTLLSPSLSTSPTSTISTNSNNKKRSSYMLSIITTNSVRGRKITMTSATANIFAAATTIQALFIEKLLPDELIMHILMYIHTDLKTLCAVAEVSPRLRRVAMQVIRVCFLPNIWLGTYIDQEGRRKSTMHYVFDSLDDNTLEICFKPITISPQRYRNDNYAAPPTLHHLSMSDANNYSASGSLSWPLLDSATESNDDNGNSRRQPSWHTLDSITSNNRTSPSSATAMNNKMIETTSGRRKQLQITKPGVFSCSTNASSGSFLWQLEYRVSTDHHSASMSATATSIADNNNDGGNERFVTPLYVKTHLSMFSKAQSSGKIYKKLSQNGKDNSSKSILQWFKKRSL